MRLPPLRAITAIEAVQRLGSLTAVAEELALTRSAVSHAVSRLEADLGFALLEPEGRGVKLTARGERYAREARKAIAILTEAATVDPPLSGALRLALPGGLGALWLADRIGGFHALHPEIRLTIHAAQRLGGMTDAAADVEIGFGDAAEMPAGATLLARVSLVPVAAPALATGLSRVADVSGATLLHLTSTVDWARWLEAAGGVSVDPGAGVVMDAMPMVHAAALAGQGVALGDSITARAALEAGQLVRPFPTSIPCRWSYFMRVSREGGPAAEALAAWIRAEIAPFDGAG